MDTDTTQRTARRALIDAVAARRAADEKLRRAVRDAHAADLPIAEIARTADVTRQTIYRWLQPDQVAESQ